MAIEPTPETVRSFVEQDDGEPVFMLNLLAFDGGEGRRRYAEYAEKTVPHLQRVGGEVLYFGEGAANMIPGDHRTWDAVIVVRYPSRKAFLDMVMDPGYQEVAKIRAAALTDAVLQPTRPWAGG